MILLFTLGEALIVIAIILLIGAVVWFKSWYDSKFKNLPKAPISFSWVTKPPSFPRNTPTPYVVKLVKTVGFSGKQEAMPNESSFVGAVTPASVKILTINGQKPGNSVTVSEYNNITAYRATTDSDGQITIVLEGSEQVEAGELALVYVVSASDVKPTSATFTVD